MRAQSERERGVDVYEIKTVAKDKSIKVLVDPASGKVLSMSGAGIFASIVNLFDDDRRKSAPEIDRNAEFSCSIGGSPCKRCTELASASCEPQSGIFLVSSRQIPPRRAHPGDAPWVAV